VRTERGRVASRCLALVVVLLVVAGCADSDPRAEETAGETYLQERLERLHPSQGADDIAVLCRKSTSGRLSCGSSVSDPTNYAAVIRQRWAVDLNPTGRVTGARVLSSEGAPNPSGRPPQTRLALDVAASEEANRRPARSRRKRSGARRARSRVEVVRLRIVPRQRVLVCVNTGRGRRLFAATRSAVVALRSARLRLRLRRGSALVTVHGRPNGVPRRAHGVKIRPGMLRPLRSGDRPCGGPRRR
jgi:hypothetical protein